MTVGAGELIAFLAHVAWLRALGLEPEDSDAILVRAGDRVRVVSEERDAWFVAVIMNAEDPAGRLRLRAFTARTPLDASARIATLQAFDDARSMRMRGVS